MCIAQRLAARGRDPAKEGGRERPTNGRRERGRVATRFYINDPPASNYQRANDSNYLQPGTERLRNLTLPVGRRGVDDCGPRAGCRTLRGGPSRGPDGSSPGVTCPSGYLRPSTGPLRLRPPPPRRGCSSHVWCSVERRQAVGES